MTKEAGERSFDELARGLASGSLSRRKALRLMGGLLVGGALASVPGVAWADDDRCPEGQTRCGDRCVNLKTNERHCGSCRNRCRSNQTCCNGNCVNLQRSERHCGRCGNRCPEGSECVGGTCSAGATTALLCQCNSPGGGGSTIAVCLSGDCDTLQADAQRICDPLCEFGFSGSTICQPDSAECGGGGG
jgi:Stigma-specific protein, Stig1